MLKHKTAYDDFVDATNDWVRHYNRMNASVFVKEEEATEEYRLGAIMLRKAIERLEDAENAMQDALIEMHKYKKELERHETSNP